MARENSTEKAGKRGRKKKYAPPRTSPEFEALIGRLRYVGDFVFGGNLEAYAAAVGLTEFWLKKILVHEARVRISTFMRFVTSGLVSAEWLFCGTGPMLMSNVVTDEISGLSPLQNMNSRYAVLNTSALSPLKMPELPLHVPSPVVEQPHETSRKTISVARQVFIASVNAKPIILFVNAAPIAANVTPVAAEMLQKKYVTGVALSLAAAELDYQQSGQTDLGAFNDIVIRAAKSGLGLGEALGAFLANRVEPVKSILAAAYSVGAPVTVHGSIGESPLHFFPAKSGAELGAAYGATGYVDSLVFAEQVRQMAGDKTSLFLNLGSVAPGLPLLSSAMAAAQEGLGLTFKHVKISRITSRKVESNLDACVCGPYEQSLLYVYQACNAIFEGNFDVYTNKDTGEQFAAFRLLNECAERVREGNQAECKREG
jgi:hypothetical protein